MNKDISPEEKLLRIIKHKSKKKDEAPPNPEKTESKPADEPEAAARIEQQGQVLPKLKNIIIINKTLVSVFAVLIVYFLVDYFFLPAVKINPDMTADGLIKEPIEKEPVKHPYSYYEKDISAKTLFKPLLKDVPEEAGAPDEKLEDIVANLALMGIVSGASPQAIIQDNKSKKTYFLNKGDNLGDLSLKEILEGEGKVILIYKEKEFDLVM